MEVTESTVNPRLMDALPLLMFSFLGTLIAIRSRGQNRKQDCPSVDHMISGLFLLRSSKT